MKLLIDTELLLVAASEPERIPPETGRLLLDPTHDLWFSAASIWEISLRGRLDSAVLFSALVTNGYSELAVSGHHCNGITVLPQLSQFAQIILSQTIAEGMVLVTSDPDLVGWIGPVRHVVLLRKPNTSSQL